MMVIIWLCYGSVSLFLMLFLLIVLGTHKSFDNAFYRLVQCDLLVNSCCYINTWILRLAFRPEYAKVLLPLYEVFPMAFHINVIGIQFFFHAQSCSILALCLHRFTTSRLESFSTFWSKYYLLVMVGIVAFSLVANIPFWPGNPFSYNYDLGIFNYVRLDKEVSASYKTFTIKASVAYLLLIVSMGIITILQVQRAFTNNTNSPKAKMVVRKMTTIVMVNAFLYSMLIFWQLISSYIPMNLTLVDVFTMMFTSSDMVTLSMPYTLFLFDTNVQTWVRRRCGRFVKIGDLSSTGPTSNVAMFSQTPKGMMSKG